MRILSVLAGLLPFLALAQAPTLKGKVLGEDGGPLPGATVTIRGTTRSTLTDSRGLFTLTALTVRDTLRITAVGYDPLDIPAGPEGLGTVTLQRTATALEEVTVNTGYQRLPRERATGVFTTISSELLNQQTGPSIMERLLPIANSMAVVPPSVGPAQLTIRGFSTIQGPSAPLVVLDNFPYDGNLANLNPQDVESVTLLKDAAAASIWGSRAGNGVIVITTKKGRFNQPLRVEAVANVTVREKPDLFAAQRVSASEVIDLEGVLFSKGYRLSDTASAARLPLTPVYEILLLQRAGRITPAEAAARLEALRGVDVRQQYTDYVYQPALNRQYAVNLRGGSGVMAYVASAGWDDNEDELGAGYRRLTLRTESTLHLHRKIELTLGALGTFSRARTGRLGYGDITFSRNGLAPYTRLIDDEGRPVAVYHNLRQTYVDTAGAGKLLHWKYYPLEEGDYTRKTTGVDNVTATAGLSYKLLSFLSLDLNYRYGRQTTSARQLYEEESYFTRNFVNKYAQINRATGAVTYKVPKGDILDRSDAVLTSSGGRAGLSLDRRWSRHAVVALAGSELSETRGESHATRIYGYDPGILAFLPVDYTTAYRTFITGTNDFIPDKDDMGATVTRFVSFFGNAAYTYADRYTLSLSGRRDASNLFGLATNDKWTPLWSAGLAWDLAKEQFYRLSFLPHLKLRGTWGYRGNVDPSMVAATTLSYSDLNPYTGERMASVRNFYNPGLRWERVGMGNLGLEGRTTGSRLHFSLDLFYKRCTDLYGPEPLDQTVGLVTSTLTKNVASLEGRGVDLELNTVNTRGVIQWTTQLNLNYYTDKILENYSLVTSGGSAVGAANRALEGYPLFTFFAFRWAGLDPATGDPQGFLAGQVSKDYNKITGSGTAIADLHYYGSSLPTLYGSMGNTVSWKGLSLTARVGWKLGYYFRRETINYTDLFSRRTGHADYARRWQKAGDEKVTDVPSMVYPAQANRDKFYEFSEATAEKGGHLRLQYLNLGYEPPARLLKKAGLGPVRLFANAANLGILWRANRHGLDPDYSDRDLVPARTWAFGLSASF